MRAGCSGILMKGVKIAKTPKPRQDSILLRQSNSSAKQETATFSHSQVRVITQCNKMQKTFASIGFQLPLQDFLPFRNSL